MSDDDVPAAAVPAIRGRKVHIVMGDVFHMLRAEERFVLRAFRNLARFRETYDLSDLTPVKDSFAPVFGPESNAALSQAILVDRMLLKIGFAQDWQDPQHPQPSRSEFIFLDLVRAGQASLTRLDLRICERFLFRRSDAVALIGRFAGMLLRAGIELPDRDGEAPRPVAEQRAGIAPRLAAVKAGLRAG